MENEYQAIRVELLEEHIDRLQQQNELYREELEILGEVINSASNSDKLNREYEKIKALEGEE